MRGEVRGSWYRAPAGKHYAPDRAVHKERNCPAHVQNAPARPRGVALAASLPPARRGPRPPSAVRDRTAGPETRSRSRRRERGRGGVSVPGNCRQGGASRLLTALFLWSDWLSCTRTCIFTCSTSPGLALRGSKEQPHACSCKPVMQLLLERVFQKHVTRIQDVGSSNPRVVAVQFSHP